MASEGAGSGTGNTEPPVERAVIPTGARHEHRVLALLDFAWLVAQLYPRDFSPVVSVNTVFFHDQQLLRCIGQATAAPVRVLAAMRGNCGQARFDELLQHTPAAALTRLPNRTTGSAVQYALQSRRFREVKAFVAKAGIALGDQLLGYWTSDRTVASHTYFSLACEVALKCGPEKDEAFECISLIASMPACHPGHCGARNATNFHWAVKAACSTPTLMLPVIKAWLADPRLTEDVLNKEDPERPGHSPFSFVCSEIERLCSKGPDYNPNPPPDPAHQDALVQLAALLALDARVKPNLKVADCTHYGWAARAALVEVVRAWTADARCDESWMTVVTGYPGSVSDGKGCTIFSWAISSQAPYGKDNLQGRACAEIIANSPHCKPTGHGGYGMENSNFLHACVGGAVDIVKQWLPHVTPSVVKFYNSGSMENGSVLSSVIGAYGHYEGKRKEDLAAIATLLAQHEVTSPAFVCCCDYDHKGHTRNTVFGWAAEAGMLELIQLWLSHPQVTEAVFTGSGWHHSRNCYDGSPPFQAACHAFTRTGDVAAAAVAELLSQDPRCKPQLSDNDSNFRTACNAGMSRIVERWCKHPAFGRAWLERSESIGGSWTGPFVAACQRACEHPDWDEERREPGSKRPSAAYFRPEALKTARVLLSTGYVDPAFEPKESIECTHCPSGLVTRSPLPGKGTNFFWACRAGLLEAIEAWLPSCSADLVSKAVTFKRGSATPSSVCCNTVMDEATGHDARAAGVACAAALARSGKVSPVDVSTVRESRSKSGWSSSNASITNIELAVQAGMHEVAHVWLADSRVTAALREKVTTALATHRNDAGPGGCSAASID